MAIQNNEELIEAVGETFLWDIVGDYVEHDFAHLKEAMRKLGYINQDAVEKITSAKIQESDEFVINGYEANNGVLTVTFEMPAVINTQNDKEDWLFRITTYCTGTVEIPDVEHYDWNALDFDDMNRLDILSHKDLAKNIRVVYEEQDTEADDLTA